MSCEVKIIHNHEHMLLLFIHEPVEILFVESDISNWMLQTIYSKSTIMVQVKQEVLQSIIKSG